MSQQGSNHLTMAYFLRSLPDPPLVVDASYYLRIIKSLKVSFRSYYETLTNLFASSTEDALKAINGVRLTVGNGIFRIGISVV
jgi:hypothetical protein